MSGPSSGRPFALVGHVVTATRELPHGAVTVVDGRISAVQLASEVPAHVEVHDIGDNFVLPGFVDAHVHCFTCPDEGFVHAGRAAIAGGVTTIVDMPTDAPAPVTTVERFLDKAQRVDGESMADVALLASVRPGAVAETAELAEAGACGLMVSLFGQDPVRYPRIDYLTLRDVFVAAGDARLPVALHPETDGVVRPLLDGERTSPFDPDDPRIHGFVRPRWSEHHAVATALEIAFETGVAVHLNQLSSARSLDLVARARAEGTPATAEVLLHHLRWTEADMLERGARLKINPPLRDDANRERLWRAVADGEVDVIASDHSPWPLVAKQRTPFLANESGAPGVQSFPSLLLASAIQRGVALPRVVQAASANPARIFGIDHRKGDIAVGRDADLVVFERSAPWTVDGATGESSAGWDAHDGLDVVGRVTRVYRRGQMVWTAADGFRSERPAGAFVARRAVPTTEDKETT